MRTLILSLVLAVGLSSTAQAQDRSRRLPPRVLQSIENRWPDAEILDVDRDDGRYDVELRTRRGVRLDVDILPNGRIVDVDVEGRDIRRDRRRDRDRDRRDRWDDDRWDDDWDDDWDD